MVERGFVTARVANAFSVLGNPKFEEARRDNPAQSILEIPRVYPHCRAR
jgi:hypothetical protein